MEKSDIPQKQILEEIMKHTHRIIRLLTLAVVSCALAASQRTFANKVSIAYKHLSSVESTYDSAVSSVVSEMRSVLREYNQPETIADQAWSYYQSAKSSMISSLGG